MNTEDIFDMADEKGQLNDFGKWQFTDDQLLEFVWAIEDKLNEKNT